MRTSFRPFKPPSVRKIDSFEISLDQILLNGQRERLHKSPIREANITVVRNDRSRKWPVPKMPAITNYGYFDLGNGHFSYHW